MTVNGKAAPRVLLVSTNTEENPYPVYPLGLECLRRPLEQDGFTTRIADCRVLKAQGEGIGDVVKDFAPDVVLVSMRNFDNNDSSNTVCYLPDLLAVVSDIRRSCRAAIVIGGSGYSLFPAEILARSEADFGVVGPAEHRIVPLLRKVMAKETPADIPGVVMRTGDRCTMTAGEVKSCTEAGVPRTPELVRFYWEHGGIMNLQLQRGCPFSCVYCTYPILDGHRIVARDVSAAVDEMQAMYEQHGVDRFFVVDSVFNMVPARSRAFAGEIIRRKMPVQWTAYFMPRGISADDLRLWKQSGLDGIEFGVDTLCPELLARWRKPFTVDDVLKSAAVCEEVGIPHALYLILGGPGETMETLEETVARAGQCRKAVVFGFVGMRIYPGTDLLKLALEEGVVTATTSLMETRFYISPLLDQDRFAQRCRQLGNLRNWLVVGRSLQLKNQLAEASRKRGVKGAMWQQLSPQ